MATFYLDTSALMKRYVTEKGSRWIRGLFSPGNEIVVARIAHAEIASAFARRVREGNVSSNRKARSIQLFNFHLSNRFIVVEIDADICSRAASLSDTHVLRAYDSVQLACVVGVNQLLLKGNSPPLIFVTSDKNLLKAGAAEGLATDNPENH